MHYYSDFTLKLIEEVRRRPILYNTRFEKRPKHEKEVSWEEIAANLEETPEKCKKHWKNIRDRFVKVMHQRDKHFQVGGTQLDAPHYVYYDKLSFMREFSIKKESSDLVECVSLPNITPDRLLYPMDHPDDQQKFSDCNEQFLKLVQHYPVLYDANAELRKYRGKHEWNKIAEAMGNKFTAGKLRAHWTTLMKKFKIYKMYLESFHPNCSSIDNVQIFQHMAFAGDGMKREDASSYDMEPPSHDEDQADFLDELNDGQLMGEEQDDHLQEIHCIVASQHQQHQQREDHAIQDDNLIEPPPEKRVKLEASTDFIEEAAESAQVPNPVEDEFDHFGKKVAAQLRNMAQKNRRAARSFEIKCLQLLMELEETLDEG